LCDAVAQSLALERQPVQHNVSCYGQECCSEEEAATDAEYEQGLVGHPQHHQPTPEGQRDLNDRGDEHLFTSDTAQSVQGHSAQDDPESEPQEDHCDLDDVGE